MSGGRGRVSGRGRGDRGNAKRGGRGHQHQHQGKKDSLPKRSQGKSPPAPSNTRKKVLLLHGNRQTGDVLLGRMDKVKKAFLRDLELDIVAPDAPHLFDDDDDDDGVDGDSSSDTKWQRTWWHRKENIYQGMEESLSMLEQLWNESQFVAILGFSQGSRLAHFIAILHTITKGVAFPGLQCIIHFSGYGDRPMPDNLPQLLQRKWHGNISQSILSKLNDAHYNFDEVKVNLPSLHVMGETDKLIPLISSEALLKWYVDPETYVFPGNHYVPVKKPDVEKYVQFFTAPPTTVIEKGIDTMETCAATDQSGPTDINSTSTQPDEEHAQAQIDEVTAMAQIFPTEFCLLSESTPRDPENYDPNDYFEENRIYVHPIKYSILLKPQDDFEEIDEQLWPPKAISLCIEYPAGYPDVAPITSLIHDMNYFELSLNASTALMGEIRKAIEEETGMPCGMGMVSAARAFFEEGGLASCAETLPMPAKPDSANGATETLDTKELSSSSTSSLLPKSDAVRIKECNAEGLEVACTMLGGALSGSGMEADADETFAGGKGGAWHYTVGLVGKPSAGKSTFFNAATAFARQRGEGGGEVRHENGDDDEESDMVLGGASMAPHPFTTIDPNVGTCLIPAPAGACPEDEEDCRAALVQSGLTLGSTHGRDPKGRRFIPVSLKDVAGLVPGAYQGRGRGNKFLDDLTDADVLIHIVDASGSSDAEGNKLCSDGISVANHPLKDLEWVRNELVQWVYFNLSSKWDSVVRRGREKLIGMFSGYKQKQSFTHEVLTAVESFVKEKEGRDVFDHLEAWDEGDLHRLVSAFLGARFPMALALNKSDLPSAAQNIKDIESQLPIYGSFVSTPMSAHEEMKFIRHHVALSFKESSHHQTKSSSTEPMDGKVWDCLQAAVSLREPVLVFPVNDMKTYEPLPGMTNYATRDSSLPNHGFISCITAAGGTAPSQWDSHRKLYTSDAKGDTKNALRDVILMRPGSTIEDVFQGLKGMGALEGEFVRAESALRIGDKPKPVSKTEVVGRQHKILRIMTTKRKEWQKK